MASPLNLIGAALRLASGVVALLGLATACVSVPFGYPKSTSSAVQPSASTRLGELTAESLEANPGESGFYALENGLDALGARLALMEQADRTIDAQYFLIKGDLAGSLFADQLLRSADRGVRVRFLVDEIFTTGLDFELSLLNAHPNIEVRLYNPIARSGSSSLNFLGHFKQANRRMHNKSFTVDNQITIVGGRNIADEYFELKEGGEFLDFDVIAIGPVAADVAETFDAFWNHSRSVPLEYVADNIKRDDVEAPRSTVLPAHSR